MSEVNTHKEEKVEAPVETVPEQPNRKIGIIIPAAFVGCLILVGALLFAVYGG